MLCLQEHCWFCQVEAINQKRTIAFINHFIAHTSHFLNRFSGVCEEKLINLHERIRQLEVSLSLLDAKVVSKNFLLCLLLCYYSPIVWIFVILYSSGVKIQCRFIILFRLNDLCQSGIGYI